MNQAYFVIIAIFLTIFGVVYTFLTYRNKERLTLIDSGLDPNAFKNTKHNGEFLLIVGLVLIGFSIGIISGYYLEQYFLVYQNPKNYNHFPEAYLSTVSLFTGLAFLMSYLIYRKKSI